MRGNQCHGFWRYKVLAPYLARSSHVFGRTLPLRCDHIYMDITEGGEGANNDKELAQIFLAASIAAVAGRG